VAFAWVRHEEDPGIARNFKVHEFPSVVFVAAGAKHHAVLPPADLGDRAGSKIKAAKSFVDAGRDGSLASAGSTSIPACPSSRNRASPARWRTPSTIS
jgi:hypothetical protein